MDPFLSDRHARWHPSGFVLTMETEGTTIGLISLEKGLDIHQRIGNSLILLALFRKSRQTTVSISQSVQRHHPALIKR